MFTQLRFTYEQESQPEEFFIPYVWQLAVANWYSQFLPSDVISTGALGRIRKEEGRRGKTVLSFESKKQRIII